MTEFGAGRGSDTKGAAARNSRPTSLPNERIARIYDEAAHSLRMLALVHAEGGDAALVAGIESAARFMERRAEMEREDLDGPRLTVVGS